MEDSDARLHSELLEIKSWISTLVLHQWLDFPGGHQHRDVQAPLLTLMTSGTFPSKVFLPCLCQPEH